MSATAASTTNGRPLPLDDVPRLGTGQFRDWLEAGTRAPGLLSALFGVPTDGQFLNVYGVVSQPASGRLEIAACQVSTEYPAWTHSCPQAHLFERELAEQWGVIPQGHPRLYPVRDHRSYRGSDALDRATQTPLEPGVRPFFRESGAGLHEVPLGPVQGGIGESVQFRFQCHGERVRHLEVVLGYQHRGLERQLIGGPSRRTLARMETLCGDTTVGHTTAYCQVLEGLSGHEVPMRAQLLRGVGLELERLANHAGDLGALAGAVGFLPTAAYCGRLRGDFLDATADLCGNRLGRSLLQPGGVGWDLNDAQLDRLRDRVASTMGDVRRSCELMWDSASVQSRFEDCGPLSAEDCCLLGVVGPAARASGIDRDARRDFPAGIYRFVHIPVSICRSGDVFARNYLKWLEADRSGQFLSEQLQSLPDGPVRAPLKPLAPEQIVVSLVEGWRGEICHVGLTDRDGRFSAYKVVDPSFHNWMALALATREQQLSDFPVNSQSFHLSCAGCDL